MSNIGLILEGGGMRGAFTAGVLDAFMARGIWIGDVYGVSAGACQACSYLAGQLGRGLRVWTDHLDDWRFCGVKSLLRTGDLFGAAFNYDLVPNRLDPVDYDAARRRDSRFVAVVTNLETGAAEYPRISDMRAQMPLIRASASMPLVSRAVEWRGRRYLDGGVADSIPLARSIADGHARNIVVLTREAGYRKGPNRALPLMALRYAGYPAFVETMRRRHVNYNAALDLVEAEADAGRAFVLRPDTPPEVGRVERDAAKLRALHDAGFAAVERGIDALNRFIGS